jgi:hypothetical protein
MYISPYTADLAARRSLEDFPGNRMPTGRPRRAADLVRGRLRRRVGQEIA